MRTPAENAKILRKVADQAEKLGSLPSANHLRECAFQLEVFEVVGLKLEMRGDSLVGDILDHVSNDEDESPRSTRPSPSDFNVSRN